MKKSILLVLLLIIPGPARAEPPKAKIIEGQHVLASDYPYVAQLKVKGSIQCSGTLISPKHVLTAAHCFFNNRNKRVVGDTEMTAVVGGQEYQSVRAFLNPAYVSRSEACVEGETDAAILELASSVVDVTPISIIDSVPPVGSQLTLLGFGLEGTGDRGQVSRFPPKGYLNIGNTNIEGLGEGPPEQNENSSYVYWRFDGGEANTAAGDSGGPAFYPVGNEFQLAAITCGGEGKAQYGTLSFDTRTDVIKPWINCVKSIGEENASPCLINATKVPAAIAKYFSYTVSSGGSTPVSITATGLPDGLTFDGTLISGVPTKPGNFSVELLASNAFGNAASTLNITVGDFQSSLTMTKVLLQFDYERGARDFLDITGKIKVGRNFKPGGKKVTIQIGRFIKNFTLRSNGLSASGNSNFFDLEGELSNSRFTKKTVRYFLTLERLAIFDEIASLGFPNSLNASEGEVVALPLFITLDGVESSATALLVFRSNDARWRIQK
jgi:hypothetical protein